MITEHPNVPKGKAPLRHQFRYLRHATVPKIGHGECAWLPYTWVVARQDRDAHTSDIWFLDLRKNWWGGDGISPHYAKHHFHYPSNIVDAFTLDARPIRDRRPPATKNQRLWIASRKRVLTMWWRNTLARRNAPLIVEKPWHTRDLSRRDRFKASLEWWTRHLLMDPYRTSEEILYHAEIGPVVWLNGELSAGCYNYVRQAIRRLQPGEHIKANSLHGAKEIVATIPVARHLFSDHNVPVLQRCFFLDHSRGGVNHYDGGDPDPTGDYSDAIPIRAIRVGCPAPQFDPRDIVLTTGQTRVSAFHERKEKWLKSHKVEQLKLLKETK